MTDCPTCAHHKATIETLTARLARAAEEARKALKRAETAEALVRNMDSNRETLGDACRLCRKRPWSGPNGERRPNHADGCPVAEFAGSAVLG